MQKAAILVSLLVLGFSWTLEGLPTTQGPLTTAQEDVEMKKLLGTWYDVIVASKIPFIQRIGRIGVISKMELQKGTTESKLKIVRTFQMAGSCHEMSGEYELTGPGHFTFSLPAWNLEMEGQVIRTNYKEYALVLMRSLKPSEEPSVAVRLYSRSKTVNDSRVEELKALAREHEMADEDIFIKADKGDCVPGQPVQESMADPEPQRRKRSLEQELSLDQPEGSGMMDLPFFNGTEACKAAPDTGPCFGSFQRYFYNSSSMSCELFHFGGCLGSQNNFINEKECLQRCRTDAVCRLPMSPQPCVGQVPIWAFDSSAGLCVPYKVGICQANGNKFYTQAECEEYCGKTEEDDAAFLSAN